MIDYILLFEELNKCKVKQELVEVLNKHGILTTNMSTTTGNITDLYVQFANNSRLHFLKNQINFYTNDSISKDSYFKNKNIFFKEYYDGMKDRTQKSTVPKTAEFFEYIMSYILEDERNLINTENSFIVNYRNIASLKGIRKFKVLFEYLNSIGFILREHQKNYTNAKYWPFKGGTSINVLDDGYNIFCTKEDAECIETNTRLSHTNNSDNARPYGYKNIKDNDLWNIVICLMQNDKNFECSVISETNRQNALKKLAFSEKYNLSTIKNFSRADFEEYILELNIIIDDIYEEKAEIVLPDDFDMYSYGVQLINIISKDSMENETSGDCFDELTVLYLHDIYHPHSIFIEMYDEELALKKSTDKQIGEQVNSGVDSGISEKKEVKVNQESINRLRRISADDNIRFKYNYEAINACFGMNMADSLQQAIWNSKDGCLVWFPHLAKVENGKYISGSSNVNWKNYFERDGEIIIEMIYSDETPNDNREPVLDEIINPKHTFMKVGDKDFRYVGTFMLDYNCSTPRYHILRRIKDYIDLTIWADGYDTEYFDTSLVGKDVFKNMYIKKKYEKQKELVEKFLKSDSELLIQENDFNSHKEQFLNKYGIPQLSTLNDFDTYLEDLSEMLNRLFETNYSSQKIKDTIGTLQEYGRNLIDLVDYSNLGLVSINDRIKNNSWGIELAAQIFTLYGKDSRAYIYTLDDSTTNNILFSLGIDMSDDASLTDKQSRIYYWRYCDDVILEWSVFRFYQFLMFMTEEKKKCIQYVSTSKPDAVKRIKNEEKILEDEVAQSTLQDAPNEFVYDSKPRLREINMNAKAAQGSMIPRHADRKVNALVRANYCCEINKEHPTFKRRKSDKNYTETHHLIPIEFSAQFQYTLDTEENIVSLCSNCHNQIHYGAGAEILLKRLYEERKDALEKAGLGETVNGIKMDLVQLLHMYGLD